MTNTFKKLGQQQVPNAATTIYTVPAATQTLIRHISVINPTVSDATIKIWHDGATDAFLILGDTTVDANGGRLEFDGVLSFETGDTFKAQSGTNNALTITLDGLEIT